MARLFLLWLMMLTLTVQGVSGAVMPLHMASESVKVSTQPSTQSVDARAVQDMSMAGCHDMQELSSLTAHDDDTGHAPAAPHKAKPCNACCLGVSVGMLAELPIVIPPCRDTFHCVLSRSVPDFIADGPERPPRNFPA